MGSVEMTCRVCGACRSSSALMSDNGSADDFVVDIENVVDGVRVSVETVERDCRICMMSLDSESFELGCSCKSDLAAVHQQCAETWFTSKGDNVCEICHSIAQNVAITRPIEYSVQQFSDQDDTSSTDEVPNEVFSTNAVSQPVAFSTDEVSVNIYEANPSSTNAILVSVSSRNTVAVPAYSTNAVRVPVSTSDSQARTNFLCQLLCDILAMIVIIMFLQWLFN